MSAFGGKELFTSGPHRFHVGGLSLRHVLTETRDGRGVQLTDQGRNGRAIEQKGVLVSDDTEGLGILVKEIENMIDGRAHELVDDLGRCWPETVMLSFEPQVPTQVGTRWQVKYRIQYLQVTP